MAFRKSGIYYNKKIGKVNMKITFFVKKSKKILKIFLWDDQCPQKRSENHFSDTSPASEKSHDPGLPDLQRFEIAKIFFVGGEHFVHHLPDLGKTQHGGGQRIEQDGLEDQP